MGADDTNVGKCVKEIGLSERESTHLRATQIQCVKRLHVGSLVKGYRLPPPARLAKNSAACRSLGLCSLSQHSSEGAKKNVERAVVMRKSELTHESLAGAGAQFFLSEPSIYTSASARWGNVSNVWGAVVSGMGRITSGTDAMSLASVANRSSDPSIAYPSDPSRCTFC